jgi:hypothetical protein
LGQFPDLPSSSSIHRAFIEQDSKSGPSKVVTLRKLIVNCLFPQDGNSGQDKRTQAAKAVRASMLDSDYDDETFVEAFKGIACSIEALKSVKIGLGLYDSDEEEEKQVESEYGEPSLPKRLRTESVRSDVHETLTSSHNRVSVVIPARDETSSPFAQHPSQEDNTLVATEKLDAMTKALNEAFKILNELKDTNSIVGAVDIEKLKAQNRRDFLCTATYSDLKAIGMNGQDIEHFIQIAHGEGEGDSSEDDFEEDSQETETTRDASIATEPVLDGDVWQTIDSVIDYLVQKRTLAEKRANRKKKSHLAKGPTAKEQANKVRQLLADAGIRSNCILNRSQSQAFSNFYRNIVGLGVRQPTVNSSPATRRREKLPLAPTSMQTRGAKRKHAETSDETTSVSFPLSPSASSSDIQTGVRTEEEARKIRSYGFPPLPGARLGK